MAVFPKQPAPKSPRAINERLEAAVVMELVVVTLVRGAGTEADPVRTVKRYYTLDGHLLAENDYLTDGHPEQWP